MRSTEVVRALLARIAGQAPLIDALVKHLGIKGPVELGTLVNDERIRDALDGMIDLEMLEVLAVRFKKEEAVEMMPEVISLAESVVTDSSKRLLRV